MSDFSTEDMTVKCVEIRIEQPEEKVFNKNQPENQMLELERIISGNNSYRKSLLSRMDFYFIRMDKKRYEK